MKPTPWEQLAEMMLDLRDHAARAVPGGGLVVEAPVADERRVARSATWPSQQIFDAPLQHVIGRQADRVTHPAAFQRLVECRHRERSVRPDHDRLPTPAIPVNDGQQNLIPPLRTMDIAWPELGREAVALEVEDEERVMADGLEVPVVRGLLPRPVNRALGAVDVERHSAALRSRCRLLNQVGVQATQSVVVPFLQPLGVVSVLVPRQAAIDRLTN